MSEFSGVRAAGIALIKRKGRPVTIILDQSAAPVDASKPWNVGAADPITVNCKAVVVDMPALHNDGVADKTVIIPGDCGLTDDQIDTKVRVLIGTLTYGVVGKTFYGPDGIPIGWKLRCNLWRPITSEQPTNFSVP